VIRAYRHSVRRLAPGSCGRPAPRTDPLTPANLSFRLRWSGPRGVVAAIPKSPLNTPMRDRGVTQSVTRLQQRRANGRSLSRRVVGVLGALSVSPRCRRPSPCPGCQRDNTGWAHRTYAHDSGGGYHDPASHLNGRIASCRIYSCISHTRHDFGAPFGETLRAAVGWPNIYPLPRVSDPKASLCLTGNGGWPWNATNVTKPSISVATATVKPSAIYWGQSWPAAHVVRPDGYAPNIKGSGNSPPVRL